LTAAARTDSSRLSTEEIAVLRRSSFINGKRFVPFFPADASYANLSGNGRWRDSDGILDLSGKIKKISSSLNRSRLICNSILYLSKAKQQKRLAGWAPAEDYIPNATIVNQVSPRNVTQTLVSDCSFVSAMILSAGYENKFHTQIITNSLFPQNRERKPVLNPYGKYCVRLHINGCWRLVEVDSRFPFDQVGRLLTSYSKDKAELWVRT
jgi:calpain-7